ncbi:tryptophan synthase alpha chain [Micractinium conductrix]|uniref:Tryptophan synthase alpha chain n=1 Tax=Micractinium conductrix TaxID=554055 RepID=A0A2P6VEB3_9CHLO|nr:tryptophan synthase alpha chain [Micractinium conductrix]|eukprot:PSC72435.1 tryptophan synthase alpha chain [Micractinium conductrix]
MALALAASPTAAAQLAGSNNRSNNQRVFISSATAPLRCPQPLLPSRLCRAAACRRLEVVAMAAATQTKSVSGTMDECRKQGRTALIPFLVACDPDAGTTVKALQKLDEIGADIIELGVPYSDPLADGPTIQAAATRALQQGTTLDKVLAVVKKASATIKAPIVMFTYYNPIMARGLDKFCRQAKEAGASGLLVPDIPLEETPSIRQVAEQHGMELVLLTTPTTPQERMNRIAHSSQGFVYLVSVTGVTGARVSMESRVEGLIKQLREVTDKAVCVGFGVSGPEQAAQIKAWGADGVICGSALVRALGESGSPEEGLKQMTALAASLRAAI